MWIIGALIFGYAFVNMIVEGRYTAFVSCYLLMGLLIWGHCQAMRSLQPMPKRTFLRTMFLWYPGLFYRPLLG